MRITWSLDLCVCYPVWWLLFTPKHVAISWGRYSYDYRPSVPHCCSSARKTYRSYRHPHRSYTFNFNSNIVRNPNTHVTSESVHIFWRQAVRKRKVKCYIAPCRAITRASVHVGKRVGIQFAAIHPLTAAADRAFPAENVVLNEAPITHWSFLRHSENRLSFMQPKGSSPGSQQPATWP
jgi:hypothetical protein